MSLLGSTPQYTPAGTHCTYDLFCQKSVAASNVDDKIAFTKVERIEGHSPASTDVTAQIGDLKQSGRFRVKLQHACL